MAATPLKQTELSGLGVQVLVVNQAKEIQVLILPLYRQVRLLIGQTHLLEAHSPQPLKQTALSGRGGRTTKANQDQAIPLPARLRYKQGRLSHGRKWAQVITTPQLPPLTASFTLGVKVPAACQAKVLISVTIPPQFKQALLLRGAKLPHPLALPSRLKQTALCGRGEATATVHQVQVIPLTTPLQCRQALLLLGVKLLRAIITLQPLKPTALCGLGDTITKVNQAMALLLTAAPQYRLGR